MSESTRPSKIAFTSFDPLVDTLPEYILTAHRPPQASTTDSAIGQIVQNSQYNIVLRQMMLRTLDPSKVKTVNIKLDRGAALQLRDHLNDVLAWWAEDEPEGADDTLAEDGIHDILEDVGVDYLEPVFGEGEIKKMIRDQLKLGVPLPERVTDAIYQVLSDADALRLAKS